MKLLNGTELAGYIKERQSRELRGFKPSLAIIRDNDTPVISKYVALKKQYGADIGVEVTDHLVHTNQLEQTIKEANTDPTVTGIILQLPLLSPDQTNPLINQIAPEKDVDGLSAKSHFTSATALAIHHLLAGYNIDLGSTHLDEVQERSEQRSETYSDIRRASSGRSDAEIRQMRKPKIAIIGKGRLVGMPLTKMWQDSGYNITVFDSKSSLSNLNTFDLIVTATGHPNLIKPEMIGHGAILVDAGTASESGRVIGDIDDSIRTRKDITITPKIGGVGPMTITMLFENLLIATK